MVSAHSAANIDEMLPVGAPTAPSETVKLHTSSLKQSWPRSDARGIAEPTIRLETIPARGVTREFGDRLPLLATRTPLETCFTLVSVLFKAHANASGGDLFSPGFASHKCFVSPFNYSKGAVN
jgi:hypothetical protein